MFGMVWLTRFGNVDVGAKPSSPPLLLPARIQIQEKVLKIDHHEDNARKSTENEQ